MNSKWVSKNFWKSLALGIAITLAQFGFVISNSPERSLAEKCLSLYHADALWYGSIVERGYVSTLPPTPQNKENSNVAFLPVFPWTAKILRAISGVSIPWALLITALIFNAVFWVYFLALSSAWRLSPMTTLLGGLLIAAHPAAFYMVSPYSESTFIATLMGFLYWLGKRNHRTGAGVILHGMAVSASRVVGVLCVLTPLLQALVEKCLNHKKRPSLIQAGTWSLLSLVGIGSFLLYCQIRWGAWNLYFLTEQIGWSIEPDYLGIFHFNPFDFSISPDSPHGMGILLMNLTWFYFPLVLSFEFWLGFKRKRESQALQAQLERMGFYFSGAVIYYVSVCGSVNGQFFSMVRFHLCTHIMLVLAGMQLSSWVKSQNLRLFRTHTKLWKQAGVAVLILLILAGFLVQARFAGMFERDLWVA